MTASTPPSPATPTLPQAAMAYAKMGMAVLPCEPDGKHPHGRLAPHGFHNATTDVATVREWWRLCPDANIGIVPGWSSSGSPDGVPPCVVLDVDQYDPTTDYNGRDTIAELEILYGDLPSDPSAPSTPLVVETPSGGQHIWLALPADMRTRECLPGNRRIGPAVDVRSGAGYVLAPPSVVNGRSYTAKNDCGILATLRNLPVLPDGWRGLFTPAHHGSPQDTTTHHSGHHTPEPPSSECDDPADVLRAIKYVAEAAPPAVEGGCGSEQTYKVACQLRELGLSQWRTFDILAEFYSPRCHPPWDTAPDARGPDSLADRVASAYRNARQPEPGIQSTHAAHEIFADVETPDAEIENLTGAFETDGGLDDGGITERVTKPARFLSDADVDAMEPPEWDIQDTLPRRSLVAVHGEPGTHKSFLALDWAYHLAHGMDWAGFEVSEPRRVLYVAGEGVAGLQKRLRAWRQHHDTSMSVNLTVSPSMPRIGDQENWSEWMTDIRAAGGFDVVIFDTLAYLTVGLEENSNADMMTALGRLNLLRDELGASVMFVHHSAKGSREMRGASAILGACETSFAMTKDDKNASKLEMRKQKDAARWPGKMRLSGTEIEVGTDREGRAVTSLALDKGHISTAPSRGEKRDMDEEARTAIERERSRQMAEQSDQDARQMAEELDAVLRAHVASGAGGGVNGATGGAGVMSVHTAAQHLAMERYGGAERETVQMIRERLRKYGNAKTGHEAIIAYVRQYEGEGRNKHRPTYMGLPRGNPDAGPDGA